MKSRQRHHTYTKKQKMQNNILDKHRKKYPQNNINQAQMSNKNKLKTLISNLNP